MGTGDPLLYPLLNFTSSRDPLCSIFVVSPLYEFIMEVLSAKGIPSLRRAGSMAACGIVSNAFEMSNCTSVSPFRDLARRRSPLSA
jgi:hypothetical protein